MSENMQKRVLHDLRDHKMTIERDDGVHRCIHFGRPGSGVYSFRLVTWPGALAIQGDCGDFMFRRLTDMFEFFRSADGEITINSGYWAEKLVAVAKSEGLKVFSPEMFDEQVKHHFDEYWVFESETDKEEAWSYLRDEYSGLNGSDFDGGPNGAHEAICAAMRYECPVTGQSFEEAYAWAVEEYGFHYLWCCHAIVWGIKRYDQHKAGRTQADHDRLVRYGVL